MRPCRDSIGTPSIGTPSIGKGYRTEWKYQLDIWIDPVDNRFMDVGTLAAVAAIGLAVGFLSGLFGKGGSAVATPLLHAIGLPAIVAVASPLPAAIPATFVAARAYARAGHVERRLVTWGAAVGLPATVAGALLTRWVSGEILVLATELLLLGLGLRFLFARSEHADTSAPVGFGWRAITVAAGVGFVSGLLANGGGFLFAPLFVVVLHRPLKDALGTSSALACLLAVPGTIVHAALGHIDWTVTFVFAVASVPFAALGAQVALRTRTRPLQRAYGVAIATFAAVFLAAAL
ncbi:MAG: hypothetical protein JWL83_4842 [Actinomycetia bacterium]|nr:hypothetical protein [Actinomycetes bacterium]